MNAKEKEVLNSYSLEMVLLEMAKRTDITGKIVRCAKALADIERHRHTAPETYAEMQRLIIKTLDATWRCM